MPESYNTVDFGFVRIAVKIRNKIKLPKSSKVFAKLELIPKSKMEQRNFQNKCSLFVFYTLVVSSLFKKQSTMTRSLPAFNISVTQTTSYIWYSY